ncbi:MAG: hypothetical protein AAF719_14170 [Pseudomonadota bacterium]
MLFLLNDSVLDIGAADLTAEMNYKQISRIPPARLRAHDVVALGQTLFFQWGDERPDGGAAVTLSAMIASKTEANAALFVRPKNATGPADVQVRLADTPITTLSHLFVLQSGRPIAPKIVNDAVWMAA